MTALREDETSPLDELLDIEDQLVLLRAVSHQKRLAILIFLLYYDPESVPFIKLTEVFNLNPNAATKHLKVLMKAELVENIYEKKKLYPGCHSFYRITEKGKNFLNSLKITKGVIIKAKRSSKWKQIAKFLRKNNLPLFLFNFNQIANFLNSLLAILKKCYIFKSQRFSQ